MQRPGHDTVTVRESCRVQVSCPVFLVFGSAACPTCGLHHRKESLSPWCHWHIDLVRPSSSSGPRSSPVGGRDISILMINAFDRRSSWMPSVAQGCCPRTVVVIKTRLTADTNDSVLRRITRRKGDVGVSPARRAPGHGHGGSARAIGPDGGENKVGRCRRISRESRPEPGSPVSSGDPADDSIFSRTLSTAQASPGVSGTQCPGRGAPSTAPGWTVTGRPTGGGRRAAAFEWAWPWRASAPTQRSPGSPARERLDSISPGAAGTGRPSFGGSCTPGFAFAAAAPPSGRENGGRTRTA